MRALATRRAKNCPQIAILPTDNGRLAEIYDFLLAIQADDAVRFRHGAGSVATPPADLPIDFICEIDRQILLFNDCVRHFMSPSFRCG
jgi:hypothetical protein